MSLTILTLAALAAAGAASLARNWPWASTFAVVAALLSFLARADI